MANSSDWLTALLERSEDDTPAEGPATWLDTLARPASGFVEGMPFRVQRAGHSEVAQPPPESEPQPEPESQPESQPEPEPEADPVADAFAKGEAAGRAAAQAEYEAKGARQMALRQSFRALDQAALDALANELAETVIALCGQVIADYAPDPKALLTRCTKAARRLGTGATGVTLHLHPDDLALLGEGDLEAWTCEADPMVERGGLRFETAEGSVSDSPSDWRRAIAAAIRG